MTRSHVIVSDIHGYPKRVFQLLSMLHDRGWVIARRHDSKFPVLYHEHETLIVAGDSNDRGNWSVPFSSFIAASWVLPEEWGVRQCVLPLMGNHDIKISKWATKGYDRPNYGFDMTLEQLQDPRFTYQSEMLARAVPEYPYWYVDRDFIAVHAYWCSPNPSPEQAIYGLTNGMDKETGLPNRVAWWETYEQDRPIIFGHYHMLGEGVDLPTNNICIDNHDGGVFSYVIADEEGVRSSQVTQPNENLLYEEFLTLI